MENQEPISQHEINVWKLIFNHVLKKMMFRMQYRDLLDSKENWIKQLFC